MVNATYKDVEYEGVVVQVGTKKDHLHPYLEEVVFYKTKNYTIRKILQLTHIPRINLGLRARLPNRYVSF